MSEPEVTVREGRVHMLKTWPQFFRAVLLGEKTFEVRSEEDRSFRVGDVLQLEEWDPESRQYTGVWLERRVTYVLRDAESFGVVPGFAVLSIAPVPITQHDPGGDTDR